MSKENYSPIYGCVISNDKYEDFFNNNIDRFDEIAENLFNEWETL